jgi:DNA polymerase delta subunit 1
MEVEDNVWYSRSDNSMPPQEFRRNDGEANELIMYGLTKSGNSVVCHVHSFYPYYYIAAPNGFEAAHLSHYQNAMENAMRNSIPKGKANGPAVIRVEMVQKQSIFGYHGEKKAMFLKITCTFVVIQCDYRHLLPLLSVFTCRDSLFLDLVQRAPSRHSRAISLSL